MYVCVCNALTERDIREAAERGARSLRAVNRQLRVASCCGRCAHSARQVLNEHLSRTVNVPEPVLAGT